MSDSILAIVFGVFLIAGSLLWTKLSHEAFRESRNSRSLSTEYELEGFFWGIFAVFWFVGGAGFSTIGIIGALS